ncbi:MAG TPA: hypothetical protein VI072_31360 [Polyangiaceae bacterium]
MSRTTRAVLFAAVAACFASGCENILGVQNFRHVPDAASSDASIDTRISEDAASDTAADTSKDSATEELDAGPDVSVAPDADGDAHADADAGDIWDALVSETPRTETVWWALASKPDGYQSLSAEIVPGEFTPEIYVSFNLSFSFQPNVPPHPSVGGLWQAPYIALRSGAAPQRSATLHVPKALTDGIELVDGADVGVTCSSGSPAELPCVGEYDFFGGYRFAEVAFEWIPQRRYRYSITRVEPPQAPDAGSSSWWEAAITDDRGTSVRIGRFRVKADSGGLQPISRTQVIAIPHCESPPPSIAAYAPRGERAGLAEVAVPTFQEASCAADGGDAASR